MTRDIDLEAERRSIQEALLRQATPEGRRVAEQERSLGRDEATKIRQEKQRKREEVDAKLRLAQRATEAKERDAIREAEAQADQQLIESRKRFPEVLRRDWGRRLGHYKGSCPAHRGMSEWGTLDPQALLRAARVRRPKSPGTSVTDFSKWVFDLYLPRRDPAWLDNGKAVERHLLHKPAERAHIWLRSVPLESKHWRILFEDDQTRASRSFEISALKIGNQSLVGKPDLVLEELRTGAIYIVERKASNHKVPTQCWHNVRAQLWAYSQIDEWADRPTVTLCAEIWSHEDGRPKDSLNRPGTRGGPLA